MYYRTLDAGYQGTHWWLCILAGPEHSCRWPAKGHDYSSGISKMLMALSVSEVAEHMATIVSLYKRRQADSEVYRSIYPEGFEDGFTASRENK